MQSFATLRMPQTIHYGQGAFKKLGEEATKFGKKALIISDRVMDELGYIHEARALLMKDQISSAVYAGVASEPTDMYVEKALHVLIKEGCDVVISLGGGSCIDTAKAVAVIVTNGGIISDYIKKEAIVKTPSLPHLAIPTTAGTGSEVTDATVITNTTTNIKMMIKHPVFMPIVAIVDPILTASSPKHITAATGIDALSHAIESYISRRAHPMTDTLALAAIQLIVHHLEKAYQNGDDLQAREAMALGALQAGIAFSNSSVCLVHGMSRPLGALFHVPHGYSNAMLLPAVLDFSKESCTNRLADVAAIFLGEEGEKASADKVVQAVKQLCFQLSIPNLRDWGITRHQLESAINKMAKDAIASGSPSNHPKIVTEAEIESLYRICFDYDFSE
ncbi:iron-containing alcohol dehydrogenase [Virgibacillus proomii]|uniref:iron-containing alcohol dehydrogenase n=1 Tax=Virgibacillus proomii TaxID=84407 RepID=UPI001C1126BA|nr:iron-containing alcohol dehydrogenase [Virgibacillus proomii]MBU5267332.1 iron-containing alcohol dehydrogenase [Virgibacillus proomii]